jgi:hypothetical protein
MELMSGLTAIIAGLKFGNPSKALPIKGYSINRKLNWHIKSGAPSLLFCFMYCLLITAALLK